MKKLLLLGGGLLALSGHPMRAYASDPDIVVVRVWDNPGYVRVVITRGEGKSEVMEFENGFSAKNMTSSGAGYFKVYHQLYQEGYVLQSTVSGSGGYSSTLLFVKAPKP
jgi:hypothetical protein